MTPTIAGLLFLSIPFLITLPVVFAGKKNNPQVSNVQE